MRGVPAAAGAAAGFLVLAPSAWSHVTAEPPTVEEGATTLVMLVTPNEREGHTTVRLALELPPQVEIASAQAPPGWIVERTTRSATWSGGSIADEDVAEFPLELRGVGPAGSVDLVARQSYEDGIEVTWNPDLTVLPASGATAPASHVGRALVAAAAGLIVVAASLAVVHRLRKRPLENE